MADLLEDLINRRDKLNGLAERYRRNRDKLNDETKMWSKKRDENNAKVKESIRKAEEHRQTRDNFNEEVRNAKDEREKLNKVYNEAREGLNQMKKDQLPKDGISISKLKRDMKNLEFKLMTSVLTIDKERELHELMKKIQHQIQEREKVLEKNKEVQGAITVMKEAKANAEAQHRHVSELADKAQAEHDSMVGIYEESNRLHKEADLYQEKFIESKMKADEEHKQHIVYIRQVHDLDKIVSGLRRKHRKARRSKVEVLAKKEAEDIYDKFKRGEKLSTEDLMALQKAGYL